MTQQTVDKIKSVMSSCETHEQLHNADLWFGRLVAKKYMNREVDLGDLLFLAATVADILKHSLDVHRNINAKIKTNQYIEKCIETFKRQQQGLDT